MYFFYFLGASTHSKLAKSQVEFSLLNKNSSILNIKKNDKILIKNNELTQLDTWPEFRTEFSKPKQSWPALYLSEYRKNMYSQQKQQFKEDSLDSNNVFNIIYKQKVHIDPSIQQNQKNQITSFSSPLTDSWMRSSLQMKSNSFTDAMVISQIISSRLKQNFMEMFAFVSVPKIQMLNMQSNFN